MTISTQAQLQHTLDVWGEEGWELVNLFPDRNRSDQLQMIFKRPL